MQPAPQIAEFLLLGGENRIPAYAGTSLDASVRRNETAPLPIRLKCYQVLVLVFPRSSPGTKALVTDPGEGTHRRQKRWVKGQLVSLFWGELKSPFILSHFFSGLAFVGSVRIRHNI